MALDDLAGYRPLWTEPLQISYRDYHVISLGLPNTGGFQTLGSLKMAEAGDLPKYGHYTTSPEALYALIQISRIQSMLAHAPLATLKQAFPNVDFSVDSRLSGETAECLWRLIQNRMITWASGQSSAGPNHSAGVVAVDDLGNVAAILHSCNCLLWGSTGIFVDGISIPDSAGANQTAIASAGRGVRLPEGTNPLIVMKNNKPVLASVAIGSGLHQATLQNLVNILDFNMDPKTSADQPNSRGPFLGMSLAAAPRPEYEREAVGEGEFSTAVLEGVRARGQAIKLVDPQDQAGYWIGIQIDRESNQLIGGVTPKLNALAEGY